VPSFISEDTAENAPANNCVSAGVMDLSKLLEYNVNPE